MTTHPERPNTLADIAADCHSIEDFGLLLRDWIHTVNRGDVSNRPALQKAIEEPPKLLRNVFGQGSVADAYLAAYAEWIADQASFPRPEWVKDPRRTLEHPWFSDNARASLLILAPASFRQRGVFTIPENIIKLRRGRPRTSIQQKKAKARLRDKRYRQRIKGLIKKGRASS